LELFFEKDHWLGISQVQLPKRMRSAK